MKCWRHKYGFGDNTDRLRLRPDGQIEYVNNDGSSSIASSWSIQKIDEFCRNHDWTECPDRMRGEPEPVVVQPRKSRKRDALIKWGEHLYRVKIINDFETHWGGPFRSLYHDGTWGEWQPTGVFPKDQCFIVARV